MKIIITSIVICFIRGSSTAQISDTLFTNRISSFTWMPDGKAILLNVMKIDKTAKVPPVSTKFRFNLKTNNLEQLPINGGGLAVSPNGKTVAYFKRVNNMDQIYLYDFATRQDKLLVGDTLRKYAASWTPDGKNILYNIQIGKGDNAVVDIFMCNVLTHTIRQITKTGRFRSYNPQSNPKTDRIVYFLEKGDQRDQIYITDFEGSFNMNLTNDTTTHNYNPSWVNKNTIIYSQSPASIMIMNSDGTIKQMVQGVNSTQFKYNIATKNIAYLDNDDNLMIYKWRDKKSTMLIDKTRLKSLTNEK